MQFNSYKPKICILLTATIDPKGVAFTQRNDPIVRENDYVNALTKWVRTEGFSFVFCENSGYRLDKVKKTVEFFEEKGLIEIIQFDGQDFPRELGKGYGELLIIVYAIKNSKIIETADYIIKISGRYYVNNIKAIAKPLCRNNDIYVMADFRRNFNYVDSRIFAFKPSFVLNYLSKFQDIINDSKGFYLEHALSRAILRAMSDGYKWMPLPCKPIITGYSGTSNTPYKTSKIRWLFGNVLHRVKNYLNER